MTFDLQCYTSTAPHDFTPVEEHNLQRIWHDTFHHQDDQQLNLQGFEYIFYATQLGDNAPIAMATVRWRYAFKDSERVEWLLSNVLAVAQCQRQGFARQLLDHVRARLCADGLRGRELYLMCTEDLVPFYKHVAEAKEYVPVSDEVNVLNLDHPELVIMCITLL